MKKREAGLLIVRTLGLCLFLNGCRYVFIIFESLMMTSKAAFGDTLLSQASGLISAWVIEAIIFFLAGIYFLRNGDFVIDLLDYEKPKIPKIGEHA